jgi:ACS family hexuronate transporter-like MFS transporter
MGALGLLWLAGWWFACRGPRSIETEARIAPVPAWKLISTRFVAFFTLSKVFMDPVWYFFVFWFPKYLSEVHHFSLQEIGWKGWVPYFTAALGNIAGGALTAGLIRGGMAVPVARKASTAVFALLMLGTIPAILVHSAPLAIALISLTTFGYTGYTANTLAFPADVFPKNTVASIWGLASMGSGFGGMCFMGLSGWLIGRFGYTPVFIGYGIAPLVALAIILFLIGPLRTDPRFQNTTASPSSPKP